MIRAGVNAYWLGSYEWDKRIAFERMLQPGWTVFDVGANVGFYTLLASDLVGRNGIVVAFEPLPRNIEFLRAHLRVNHVRNVVVYEVAVSDVAGRVSFEPNLGPASGRVADNGRFEVQSVTLDDFVTTQTVGLPDVIKMDIEGGELRALRGAKRILRDGSPLILLATHSTAIHESCCSLLGDLGFSVRRLPMRAQFDQLDEVIAWKQGSPQAAFVDAM